MDTGHLNIHVKQRSVREDDWDQVEIFGVRFPRKTRHTVLKELLSRIEHGIGGGVCFPDMSTMNLVIKDDELRQCLQTRLDVFNDGAGLAWAARRKGKPFPDNLNGTDLVPRLLDSVPMGTRVFVLGGKPKTVESAVENMQRRFPCADFVGWHHGYLDSELEDRVVEEMRSLQPNVVLVAMGNPLQIRFIDRHKDKPGLEKTIFFAVGGLLHYFSGELVRAPRWVRRCRLEWLFITVQQPYKFRRYFFGIPKFLFYCLKYESGRKTFEGKTVE